MDNCIFCKIVEGDIPAAKVYEDKDILGFLDIAPTKKGHTLIIPKAHYKALVDVPDELLMKTMLAVKKASNAVMAATGAEGINLSLNMHEAAGQVVPHAHFHIIPRHKGDGLKLWPQGKYEPGEIEDYSSRIRARLF